VRTVATGVRFLKNISKKKQLKHDVVRDTFLKKTLFSKQSFFWVDAFLNEIIRTLVGAPALLTKTFRNLIGKVLTPTEKVCTSIKKPCNIRPVKSVCRPNFLGIFYKYNIL